MQDIDDILRNRTEKRQLGNSKGNTFSTATFAIQEEDGVAGPIDPREYWSAILPEAVADHDAQVRIYACSRPLPHFQYHGTTGLLDPGNYILKLLP